MQYIIHAASADIIRFRGYIAEDYFVTTSDDYILRLIKALNFLMRGRKIMDRKPVVFVHGCQFNEYKTKRL